MITTTWVAKRFLHRVFSIPQGSQALGAKSLRDNRLWLDKRDGSRKIGDAIHDGYVSKFTYQ